MSVAGACPECAAELSADQRYCVECGHRVEASLAPSYLPTGSPVPAARRGGWPLPIPMSMAGVFAALALGFGVIAGTAVSPNLASLVAGEYLGADTQIAQAPPPEPPAKEPRKPSAGTDTGTGIDDFGSGFYGSPGSSYYGGGSGSSGGTKPDNPKEPKEKPTYLAGTVIHDNPVAGSYSISSGGGISAIHAKTLPNLPQPGTRVKVPVRPLPNRTYAEDGKRQVTGQAVTATFAGIVTDSRNGALPGDPDAYTVSGPGASVLVYAPDTPTPPTVGALVTPTVDIRPALSVPPPPDPPGACLPPLTPFPAPPVVPTKELFQSSIAPSPVTVAATEIETVVQSECPGAPSELVLSSDDVRQGLSDVTLPAADLDLDRFAPGQAIMASVTIAGGALTGVTGTTSDQGIKGAEDKATGQGNLAEVARASARTLDRSLRRPSQRP